MSLPEDLKSVKKRICAGFVIENIVAKIVFTILILLGTLFILGYLGLMVFVSSLIPPADGNRPARIRPFANLKEARNTCRIRIYYALLESTTYEFDVIIEQEHDFNPYYAFYGRIELARPELCPPDYLPSDARIDFFYLTHFNADEADRYMREAYSPRLYDCKCINLAEQFPLLSSSELKSFIALRFNKPVPNESIDEQ